VTNPAARIKTNYGAFVVEVFTGDAPKSAANFLEYVKDGFYDNTLMHRVVAGFVAQGGGFERGMYQKATRPPIENEAANGLKNEKYTVAMARTPDPHSATSQFFVNLRDNPSLDHSAPEGDNWGYCVFGRVREGMDVVDAIGAAATEERMGHSDVPAQDIVIESAELLDDENGGE
jgi:peptidyl-prolyl cis-trans isomerase B (cyclophilin B)